MNTYKKFFLYALALILTVGLSASSCDDEEDPVAETLASSLAGTWTATALTVDGQPAGINLGAFSMTLNVDGQNEASTYNVTFGAVPEFAAGSGSWSVTNAALNLSGTSLSFNGAPTSSRMVFTFTDTNDKTNPTYELTLTK